MSVPDAVKKRLADEIAKDYCFRPEILALVYVSELQQQEEEHREHQVLDTDVQNYGSEIEESQIAVLIDNKLKGKTLYVDSMSTSRSSSISTHSCQNSRTSSSSMNSSISQQSSPDVRVYPMHNKAEKKYNFSRLNSQSKYEVVTLGTEERPVASSYDTTAPEHKGERKMTAPSSES
ncbi:hypothetical protein Peur_025685 [Populus x canadensis]